MVSSLSSPSFSLSGPFLFPNSFFTFQPFCKSSRLEGWSVLVTSRWSFSYSGSNFKKGASMADHIDGRSLMADLQESHQGLIAVVTGANKGIGFEIVRQLGAARVTVVLTARDEGRGVAATSKLHNLGFSNVVFHQLDVSDVNTITSLVHFIEAKFGKLDILVNNAGVVGMEVDEEGLKALDIDRTAWLAGEAANLVQGVMKTTYEKAEECINTNYYGAKIVTEALLPLLKLSTMGSRIVNISSIRGELKRIPNDQIRSELENIESLTEEKIHAILQKFLGDVKQDKLIENGWPLMVPAYGMSKIALNAYTRLLAKKNPNMYINCVRPGNVKTDLNWHTGDLSPEDGAKAPVRLALLADGGPTGCYFDYMNECSF